MREGIYVVRELECPLCQREYLESVLKYGPIDKLCTACEGILQLKEKKNPFAKSHLKMPMVGSVFHGYVEYGLKGGPKRIESMREVKEIEKRTGKIWASDTELDQECEKNYKRNVEHANEHTVKDLVPKLHEALRR